jgi:hypothetical protein
VHGQQHIDAFEECLQDDGRWSPADAAAFKIDWSAFLQTVTKRDRRLAAYLSLGHSGKRAAVRFKLSPGRVTQIRQRMCREWYAMGCSCCSYSFSDVMALLQICSLAGA